MFTAASIGGRTLDRGSGAATRFGAVADGNDIDLNWAGVYWTHAEMFGRPFVAAEMAETLGQIAVDDLLEALARLSCMVEGADVTDGKRQLQILRRVGFEPELVEQLERLFVGRDDGRVRTLFFPQQAVELTRLALRHGDRRPRDGFDSGRLAGPFIRCLFGVSDLLGTELGSASSSEVRGFMLRQLGLMSRQETLYLFSRYYELLVRLWPRVHEGGGRFEPAEAFREYTGLTLEEYFTVGFAVYTRFLNHSQSETEPQDFALAPAQYFSTTKLEQAQWETFLGLLSRTPDELRDALSAEDARYGPGLYRSHTFDRAPLAKLDRGMYVPTSFAALERAVTEGAFWLLADAAEAKGLRREDFTSPFGGVFERFAQESLERIAALEREPPRTYRDFSYGPKKTRALSSDMTFLYDREGIFFEVVTGQASVATLTRGNDVAFREDLRRLVLKKAAQLRRCWRDLFQIPLLRFEGVPPGHIQRIWPVLILIEGFPLMPPLYGEVVDKLRRDGWPKIAPRLALIDADELAALEALVEQGWTTDQVLRTWRREAPELPMSNWLAQSPSSPERIGHASWHMQSFKEVTDLVGVAVFGKQISDLAMDE